MQTAGEQICIEGASSLESWVALAAQGVEAAGVTVIVASVPAALAISLVRRARGGDLYSRYRRALGRGILLGLELLVGADIIRTVSEVPTLMGVVTLALIVLVRTFLSFTLEVELEGRWPWQHAGRTGEGHRG